jgi:SAM-dependent methyltransferase
MSKDRNTNAYAQAAESGRYECPTGLIGKYDNVRRYWEDANTRRLLAPYVKELAGARSDETRRIRLFDLGCGSGDGLDLLLNLKNDQCSLEQTDCTILTGDNVAYYKGVDLNEALLAQARTRFGDRNNTEFAQADLTCGLPVEKGEEPYDIYFTSYGTLSHLHTEDTVALFTQIAKHAPDGALIVGDWLGRFSYEWQHLWNNDISEEQWMDYRISYIYTKEQRENRHIDSFDLRLLDRREIESIAQTASEKAGVTIEIKTVFDRSIAVGRHMETGEYNSNPLPIRSLINRLFERSVRTKLSSLVFHYHHHDNFNEQNRFLSEFATDWNELIGIAASFFQTNGMIESIEGDLYTPERLSNRIRTLGTSLRNALQKSQDFVFGDIRANVMEPLLGYALRNLELTHQKGIGCGHGLVGIFKVHKSR